MAFAPTVALDYLRRAHDAGRLGHAYLLIGAQAATDLAAQLASLVVKAPVASILTHPDVHLVEPESKSRRISIELIRELENSLRLRASAAGGRKVGIISQADRLTNQASNAFLKTLEEPPAGCLLLLVSDQPDGLMETILSRCLKVSLLAPEGKGVARMPEEKALRALLDHQIDASGSAPREDSSVATAYRLAREFSGLLASAKGRLQADTEAALAREEEQYAKTTDGSWLDEREAYYKSLTEARYVAVRSRLVEVLALWWGERLRGLMNEPASDALAASVSKVLQRISAVEELRENLDRNIQEALALEVAFLKIVGD